MTKDEMVKNIRDALTVHFGVAITAATGSEQVAYIAGMRAAAKIVERERLDPESGEWAAGYDSAIGDAISAINRAADGLIA